MGMKNGLFLIFLLTFHQFALLAQVNRSGAPVVRCFDAMETPGDPNNVCVTMDKRGVMYFGSQRKGILTYDGTEWGVVHVHGEKSVNSLCSDHRGVVYAGMTDDFGLLQPDDRGDLSYVSLADRLTDSLARKEVGTICSITSDSSFVYFTDGKKLYLYDIDRNELAVTDLSKDHSLANAALLLAREGSVIIADNREGLFELKEGVISLIPGGDRMKMMQFRSIIVYDRDNLLIASSDSGVFLFNLKTGELKSDFLSTENNDRLKAGSISGAVRLPGNRFAVGVNDGEGISIFSNDGRLQQQISSETTGIPESAITAMFCDYLSNSQLWFCTQGYINRAYVSLPVNEFFTETSLRNAMEFGGYIYAGHDLGLFRSFVDHDNKMQFLKLDGVKSKVFDLIVCKNSDWEVLIAGTTEGLFQIDEYEQVSVVLDQVNITAVKSDTTRPDLLLAGTDDGKILTIKYLNGRWKVANISYRNATIGAVSNIELSAEGEWWVLTASPDRLYRMQCTPSDTTFVPYDETSGLTSKTLNRIVTADNNLYICTGNGLFLYNPYNDLFEKDNKLVGTTFGDANIHKIIKTAEGDIVLSGFDKRHFDALVTPTRQGHVVFRRQFDFLPDIPTADIEFIEGNVWIVKGRNLYVVDKAKLGYGYGSFSTFFTGITAGSGTLLMDPLFYTSSETGIKIPSVSQAEGKLPVLRYFHNDISFRWTATSYVEEGKTEYRHRLDGFDDEWSKWEKRNAREYTNLPSGHYTFRLKAKTSTGLESEEALFSFSVREPFYTTAWALAMYTILLMLLIYATARFFSRRLRNENIRLEQLAGQKTADVVSQKNELDASVHYASRIQRALLPPEKILADQTPNYFILFKPRDVVSGDFYWMARREEKFFLVAADCTGHGVPGAFMSLLGISFLDEIINKQPYRKASHILNELRKQVIDSLKQTREADERRDGINMALLVFDYTRRIVEFSGAYSPCFKVRPMNEVEIEIWEKGEFETDDGSVANGRFLLETVYGSKMTVGISARVNQDFTQSEWVMERDISYYLFTDGYINQFNGTTGRKFMKKNFIKLILEVQDYPMNKQMEILDERIRSWMGSSHQVDDILVMGFKAD